MRHAARNTDPSPSHTAAGHNRRGRATQCQQILEAFAYVAGAGYTDHEAAQHAALDIPGVCWWHRASDLRARGLIQWLTGPDGARVTKKGDHGTVVGVSVITADGLRWLQ